MSDVWLITGMPGVGKTTTARALAAKLPRSAHIEGDTVRCFIISGSALPDGTPAEKEAQRHLVVRNQCLLARSFADDGFVPVIDYVIYNQAQMKEYLGHLQGLRPHFVSLMPGPEVAIARDSARTSKGVAAEWAHLDPIMREEFKSIGLWVDNGRMDVDAVVEEILSNQTKALVI